MTPRCWLAGLLLALGLTVPAWWPWLGPLVDLRFVDDAKNHMLRIYVLRWMLQHGVWYPRWVPDLYMGYGYPVFNFYAPVFYYVALVLQWALRLDIYDAFRATGVVASLVGAAGAYALVTGIWARPALGALAAVSLLYGPYAFQINLFKRGAIPEALGIAILPWLLLAIWRAWFAAGPGQRAAWAAAVAGFGALAILVHNITALMSAGVAALWVVFLLVARPHWSALRLVVAGGLLAPLLAAFFWLPALVEGPAVQLDRLRTEQLDYRPWLLDPTGNTVRQQAGVKENRQTRTGLIDTHLFYPSHYPQELWSSPKPSPPQAIFAVIALASLLSAMPDALWRRLSPRRRAPARAAPNHQVAEPLAEAPAARDAARRSAGWSGAPLLALAAAALFLMYRVAAPVWDRVAALQLLQFPWRLLGPMGVCLAVAGAGGVSRLLDVLARRWRKRGIYVGWGLVALLAAGTMANALGDRVLLFDEVPPRAIDGDALVKDESVDRLGIGTTSGREFLPREVQIAVYTTVHSTMHDVHFPRDQSVFERLYPEHDWLGGYFTPLAGDLRFLGWRVAPLRLGVRVVNDSPSEAQLGIRQLRFLGWRAWLDGRPTPIGVPREVPEQQAFLGFMVVAVPPGEHTISLTFGPTTARLAGTGASMAAALVVATIGVWLLRGRRGWPAASGPLIVAGAAALAASLVWRSVWPLAGRLSASPPPPAGAVKGVWQAADLSTRDGGLLVNVAEAVRTGQARISSPSGSALGPDRFVDVRQITIADADDLERGWPGTSRREWLYLHPPSEVSVDVALPPREEIAFQTSLALDPAAWSAPVGDGVRYLVTVARLDGASNASEPVTVLDQDINPRARTEQRRWVPVRVDLSPWAGARVRFTLRTLPRDELSFDWSGWANPVVVVDRETARGPSIH